MKLLLKSLRILFLFFLLTLLTQVGGLIYLLYLPIRQYIERKDWKVAKKRLIRAGSFSLLYLFICLLIIPILARQLSGRQALPWWSSQEKPLAPVTLITCLLNRHYVDEDVSRQISHFLPMITRKLPNTRLSYLDANFPFMDGFPLIPHLSHDDGRKLDIAFLYQDPVSGQRKNGSPSFTGYGVCEEPQSEEWDQARHCQSKGYWQYSLLRDWMPQFRKQQYQFDHSGNRWLLEQLAKQKGIRKLFIEPHLKKRLGLAGMDKIRYHGCQAVRHDDHIHLEF